MRLLHFRDDGRLACTEFGKHHPEYAILSHTWGDQEVTFQDLSHLSHTTLRSLSGYRKLEFCGWQAARDGLKYFWVDTCCVDRQNLPELTEAINKMFLWYHNAAKCYVYLPDVSLSNPKIVETNPDCCLEAFRKSRWFTRGWTVQELIAPTSVEFFSIEGCYLGSKESLELELTAITGIPAKALRGEPLNSFSILERFSWTKDRKTTKDEDMAYCLLGIFDIFMPIIYGEGGANAYKRLEILINETLKNGMVGKSEQAIQHSLTNPSESSISSSAPVSGPDSETNDNEDKQAMIDYLRHALGGTLELVIRPGPWQRKLPTILSPWHQALCFSQDVAQGANSGSVFQESYVSLLKTIDPHKQQLPKTFSNRSDMMTDLRCHCENARHSSRLLTALKSVDSFSLKWEYFFTVAEFAIDVDSEWSRVVWGVIHSIFMQCMDFVNVFEKLAQMLDTIRRQLPSYHDHVLRLRDDCPEITKNDLSKTLSFVYADIVNFCQEAFMLFEASFEEVDTELDTIETLLSTPFTHRFELLLERLSEHKGLFDVELRAGRHTSLRSFIAKVTKDLESRQRFMQEKEVREYLEEKKRTRDRTLQKTIRNWTQPSEYEIDFKKAGQARSPGSCVWLQSEQVYISWKAELRTTESNSARHIVSDTQMSPPILWLEGPPGYGKTVLSASIVEDLTDVAHTEPVAIIGQNRAKVIYFYFKAQVPGKQSFNDALRAMATQLVEELQDDAELLDLASILMIRDESGRFVASEDDLTELFLLSIRKCSSLALVLDGIDECRDFKRMWHFLSLVCSDRRVRCLLLGRLTVKVPPVYAHLIRCQSLLGLNRQDVRNYLHREVENLQAAGLLQKHHAADHVAGMLTSRANCRFLWASLMVSYLQNPSLSHAEREREIENSTQLESLHDMYLRMLRQFELLSSSERNLLMKILQFLALAKAPPTIEKLNMAISIRPGRKLSKEDQVLSITDTLRRLCGALIDIGPDSTVSFSHLSFRTFLLSKEATQVGAPFRVNRKADSLRIAVVCLSYLINDVPQGPLSGLPETAADRDEIALQLPFAEYAARYWIDHAVDALQLASGTLHELIANLYPLLQQLSLLLSRKASISAWIETCWIHGVQPSIEKLWEELKAKLEPADTEVQKHSVEWHLSESIDQIRTLTENLRELDKQWGHLLSVRPYEIWGASISAFFGPTSGWNHNDEADVTLIASDAADEVMEETILEASKLSVCGKYLGVVRVSRSSASSNSTAAIPCACDVNDDICDETVCNEASPVDLANSSACYEILEIKPGFSVVQKIPIDLNAEDLHEVERTAEGANFRFPIAFTPNLQCISVLRTLYWKENDGSIQQQRLDAPVLELMPEPVASDTPMQHRRRRRKRQKKNLVNTRQPHDNTEEPRKGTERLQQIPASRSSFYKLKFSPCGHYVACADRQHDMNDSSEGRWTLSVWERDSSDVSSAQAPGWQRIAMLSDVYGDFLTDGNFAFNPQFQMIAILEVRQYLSYQASVWNFGVSAQDKPVTQMVYATGLRNLHFSPDGRILFGDHFHYRTFRVVPLERYLVDVPSVPLSNPNFGDDHEATDTELKDHLEDSFMEVIQTTSTQLTSAGQRGHTIQASNTLTLATSNGVPELSAVRSYVDGAVVLKRLSPFADDEKCLIYLPDGTNDSSSVTVLDGIEGSSDTIRIAVVPESRDAYTWGANNHQPARIITRSVHSIQQYKLPSVQHAIDYRARELSSLPNAGAQRLLAFQDDNPYDMCGSTASSVFEDIT